MEKLLEFMGNDFLEIPSKETNEDYLKTNIKKLEPLLDHFHITVCFKNVSGYFLHEIIKLNLSNICVNEIEQPDLSFWLSPTNGKSENNFGYMVQSIYESIQSYIEIAKRNNISEDVITKNILSMQPKAVHQKCIITASISSWKDIILTLSRITSSEEHRYVLLNLLRDFKMRYFYLFCDIAVMNKDKKILGIDSIKSDENAWMDYESIRI
jgi:hypothetical protein